MDTAGIRETEDIVEKIGVDRAREMAQKADLILYVVDSSVPLDSNDEEIMSMLNGKKAIILYNKTDLKAAIEIDRDVYKRQVYHVYYPADKSVCCCPVQTIHHPEAEPAYLLLLDVYKRQPVRISPSSIFLKEASSSVS